MLLFKEVGIDNVVAGGAVEFIALIMEEVFFLFLAELFLI